MTPYYIIYNGILKKADDKIFNANNRAFLYGDGFFETIYAYYDKIPFLKYHYNRIINAAEAFSFELPSEIIDIKQLKKTILYLAHKNKIYKSYRIRITFYREGQGLYLPQINKASYIITLSKLDFEPQTKTQKLIKLALDEKIRKDYSIISMFKTISPLSVLAAISAEKHKADDLVIINSENFVVETSNSNIFIVIDDKLITPPVACGCVDGITRHLIINYIARNLNLHVIERCFSLEQMHKASEIFITNSISFVSSVREFQKTFYFNSIANKIHKEFLNFLSLQIVDKE